MKNKISCQMIEDLLPLYIDHLTQDETNQIIQEHLEQCPECQQKYLDLTVDEQIENPIEEVNYLKKIKNTNKRKFKYGILTTLAVLTIGVVIKVFIIGITVNSENITITNQERIYENNTTYIKIDGIINGNQNFKGYKIDENHNIIIYSSPNILNNDNNNKFQLKLECQNEIDYWYLAGNTIYNNQFTFDKKDTNEILLKTKDIFKDSSDIFYTLHMYVHIMQHNSHGDCATGGLSVDNKLVHFQIDLNEELDQANMRWMAAVCFSFTDDLEKVSFYYQKPNLDEMNNSQTFTYTVSDLKLKHDIKYYGNDLDKLNSLYDEIFHS